MKLIRTALLTIGLIVTLISCRNTNTDNTSIIAYNLTDETRQKLIEKLLIIGEKDQRYRQMISLGTMDEAIIKKDREMSNTPIEEYLAFSKTIKRTISKKQVDSLWVLQKTLDFENYNEIVLIIEKFGYPSKERLQVESDKIYAMLLHPPKEIKPRLYLNKMTKLLKPEVTEGRMEAKVFASFVDNIKSKILKKPQLYGTNKLFNPETMSVGLPKIEDIKKTNEARKEIGLPELKEGQYQLVNN